MFQEKFLGVLEFADVLRNGFGLSPSVGILFSSGLHENLFVTTELTYSHIFAERNVKLIAFGIGLKYVFD